MTPDAALDQFAFLVGLRLMGTDARRRLRIALVRSPDFAGQPGFDVECAERLDALLDGRRPPETLQDRVDLARVARERTAAPFGPSFWAERRAELVAAGFEPEQAARLVDEVRHRVDPSRGQCVAQPEEETA